MRRTELMTLAPSFRSFRRMVLGTAFGQGRLFQGDAADTVDEDIGESSNGREKLISAGVSPTYPYCG